MSVHDIEDSASDGQPPGLQMDSSPLEQHTPAKTNRKYSKKGGTPASSSGGASTVGTPPKSSSKKKKKPKSPSSVEQSPRTPEEQENEVSDTSQGFFTLSRTQSQAKSKLVKQMT